MVKLYFQPKTHKVAYNIPNRPVSTLARLKKNFWSFCQKNFINETQKLKDIPKEALLVKANFVGLYESTPQEAALKSLKEALDKRENRTYPQITS